MTAYKRSIVLCLVFLLTFLLVSCTAEDAFDAGTPLTSAELAAMKAELEGGDKEQTTGKEEGDTSQNGTVFWIDSGKVWHKSASCYHIAGKTNIRSGAVDAATAAGKTRACSACD